MDPNSNDEHMKQLLFHHNFIIRTDRKSLHSQIKSLVLQAQEVALKELNERRAALHKLLDYEDKIYEEEFANKVKSRLDEDIKERKDVLLKIKEESTKNEQEFLKSKRIQQYMNSCYEIREALRRKELQEVKTCQLEQILEKERSIRTEQQKDQYWYKVQQKNLEIADKRQYEEQCLKSALRKNTNETLRVQVEELEEKREKEMQEKLAEKERIDALLEELRLEEFDSKMRGKPAKVFEYRQELFDMMDEKRSREKKEARDRAEEHMQAAAEAKRLDAEEAAYAAEKKKNFQRATLDYIKYVQRMRELGSEHERMFDECTKDLRRVDICTKANILRERRRKARIAEQCYAELRKQICEQQEKRMREEAEQRECKILENRFGRDNLSREQILAQRRKNREELDKQIAELNRIREAEEAKFNTDIQLASNDPEFCSVLADKYIHEGIDYLEPHANWRILSCPTKRYVTKPPASTADEVKGVTSNMNFTPCGCVARGLSGMYPNDGRGDQKK